MTATTRNKWNTFYQYEDLHAPVKLSKHIEREAMLTLDGIEYFCQFDMEISWYRNNDGGWPTIERLWPVTAFDCASHEVMDKHILARLNSLALDWVMDHVEEIVDDIERLREDS